ncbi:MAG: hypothetical protein KJI71_05370 [Patescibacteria group bacterium]|nr:hypothetical protein [Patescibacteria group bacterium]
MEISAEKIADITEIYHAIQVEQANLNRTDYEGPNAREGESIAAKRLLFELIPHYRKITPPEVQDYLNLDLAGLEKTCRASLG